MSLKEDLDKAKEAWKGASLLFRAWLVLSIFLSSNSIASMSEVVVNWKGFIRDGIEFYHLFVTEPLMRLVAPLGLRFTPLEADMATLVVLTAGAAFRHDIIVEWPHLSADRKRLKLTVFLMTIAAAVSMGVGHMDFSEETSRLLDLAFAVFSVAWWVVTGWMFSNRVVYFSPLLLSGAIVLLLGAINKGLRG